MTARRSITLQQARELVLAACAPLEPERVPVADALGRVLAAPLVAHGDVPAFDNSAMDGFAVRAGAAGRRLELVGESRAGGPAEVALREGQAIRISTGAALPDGADSVVRLERAQEHDGRVTVNEDAAPGLNVRRAGEDMRAGAELLAPGARLGPAELAVAVTAGHADLRCTRRPAVAVLATGDELRPAGAPLAAGQIHDSNSVALATLAQAAGAHVASVARTGDDAARTREALATALAGADVVTVSGGVSVGPHDHVKDALAELGVEELFWGIRIRPGRPTWFGVRGRTLVFGLPGNPVSTIVIHMLLVRGALAALQGADPAARRVRARLADELPRNDERDEAVRVSLDWSGEGPPLAAPCGPQGSHVSTSLLGADGLALVEAGPGTLAAGTPVEVELL